MVAQTPPTLPRLVGDPTVDLQSLAQWLNEFYTATVRESRLLDPQYQDERATETNASITAATDAATQAQETASGALQRGANLDDLADTGEARTNLGLTPLASATPVAGWADPTGAGARTTFDMNWTQAISASPTQTEVQALVAQIVVLQKIIGQLVLDQKAVGTLAA